MKFTDERLFTDAGIYEAHKSGLTPEYIAELRYKTQSRREAQDIITPKKELLKFVYEALIREYKKEVEKINAH